jgi:hypothetical protein
MAILLITMAIPAKSQIIKGAVIVGANFAQVDGDEVFGYHRYGANLGLAAIIPFSKTWSVSLETLFSQKGSSQGAIYYDERKDSITGQINILTGEYQLRMNYVEVPLIIRYTDKEVFSLGAGISYARLVSINEEEHGKKVETTYLNSGTYKKDDWLANADLMIRLHKNLHVNLRYSYSLFKLRTRDFYNIYGQYVKTRDQFNNLVSLRLIWVINERAKSVEEIQAETAY